jgi:hypothetical protein
MRLAEAYALKDGQMNEMRPSAKLATSIEDIGTHTIGARPHRVIVELAGHEDSLKAA